MFGTPYTKSSSRDCTLYIWLWLQQKSGGRGRKSGGNQKEDRESTEDKVVPDKPFGCDSECTRTQRYQYVLWATSASLLIREFLFRFPISNQ